MRLGQLVTAGRGPAARAPAKSAAAVGLGGLGVLVIGGRPAAGRVERRYPQMGVAQYPHFLASYGDFDGKPGNVAIFRALLVLPGVTYSEHKVA